MSVYITAINQDGSITKSSEKSITVSEYTDLPAIYEQIFGLENGNYGTTKWTWDDTLTRYWGNGGCGSDTTPAWWGAPDGADINEQCEGKGLPNDGVGAWFTLSLTGVETSRGETGSVKVSEDQAVAGWGVGTMTFSGTIPLLGGDLMMEISVAIHIRLYQQMMTIWFWLLKHCQIHRKDGSSALNA